MSSNAALDKANRLLDAADNGLTVRNTAVDSYENAGVDGNAAHTGGYHRKRKELPKRSDYSGGNPGALGTSPRDLGGPDDVAAATDMHFDQEDMITVSKRIQAAIDRRDPRLANVREVNIWFGPGTKPVNRDALLNWRSNYDPDGSHESHIHVAWFRDRCWDYESIKGFYEIVTTPYAGESSEEDELSAASEILARIEKKVDTLTDRIWATLPGSNGRPSYFTTQGGVFKFSTKNGPGMQKTRALDTGDGNSIMTALSLVAAAVAKGNDDLKKQLDALHADILSTDSDPEANVPAEAPSA